MFVDLLQKLSYNKHMFGRKIEKESNGKSRTGRKKKEANKTKQTQQSIIWNKKVTGCA